MVEQVEIQNAWTEIAPAFDEFVTPSNIAIAEEALQRVGLRPEMRVLDVAAGSGALSIPAAQKALNDKLHERSGGSGPTVLNNSVNIGIGIL